MATAAPIKLGAATLVTPVLRLMNGTHSVGLMLLCHKLVASGSSAGERATQASHYNVMQKALHHHTLKHLFKVATMLDSYFWWCACCYLCLHSIETRTNTSASLHNVVTMHDNCYCVSIYIDH
jgi:thiol:disulfide interchange protein